MEVSFGDNSSTLHLLYFYYYTVHFVIIRVLHRMYNLDLLHVKFTVGFLLLWDSNATVDLKTGTAQAVKQSMGRHGKCR